MSDLKFAIVGTGFWAPYQLAAWRELDGVECAALCDNNRPKAAAVAANAGVAGVYADTGAMLEREKLDFVDVISSPETHADIVETVARAGLPVICQKPMTQNLAAAERLVATCRDEKAPFFVHENWRWQAPIRAFKAVLDSGEIGEVFRARIQ